MKNRIILCLFCFIFGQSFSEIHAQNNEGHIYGEVITKSGSKYKGPIRWGKEEVFWFDHFNGNKVNYDFKSLLRRSKSVVSGEYVGENVHFNQNKSFQIEFGNITQISLYGESEVELELQNGKSFYVKNGSNDFGADIRILDQDLGEVKVEWRNIQKVIFEQSPANIEDTFGKPLYGTVKCWEGEFTGYIQWDHDERLSTDLLNGETNDGSITIPFGKIRSLSRSNNGCELVSKSGKTIFIDGSNDVNSSNKGVIVNIIGKGRVDIPWSSFRSVKFEDKPLEKMKVYSAYKDMYKLAGTVTIDSKSSRNGETLNKQYTGGIVYDLDEAWSFEMLDGKQDKIKYMIPFSSISAINPSGYNFSYINYKNGKGVELSGGNDVNRQNDGLLMFIDAKESRYIPWKLVKKIEFK